MEFEMKDLSPARSILGIEVTRERSQCILTLSKQAYINKIVKKFNLEEAKVVLTPIGANFKLPLLSKNEDENKLKTIIYLKVVRSVMYAMVNTRPDIAYTIALVSRFMSNTSRDHWNATKWLIKCLKGAAKLNLKYSNQSLGSFIKGFFDSNYAANLDKRRSISGYVSTIEDNTISWKSTPQQVVALSTTEVEYMVITEVVKQDGDVEIKKISFEDNPADMLTEVVLVGKFKDILNLLNMAHE
ncbi:secreted RxLR effector protein 161-like [Humulus lupulus]|uniref:secreted RxLR effector protein 161-like n=1 Tax=Humulus lupulus TaxID=3486 RepID=UPI002B413F0D|nr:secreted RxLR effector protein 161-like [Humulus lupulus]